LRLRQLPSDFSEVLRIFGEFKRAKAPKPAPDFSYPTDLLDISKRVGAEPALARFLRSECRKLVCLSTDGD
jgi:hypothetical protein